MLPWLTEASQPFDSSQFAVKRVKDRSQVDPCLLEGTSLAVFTMRAKHRQLQHDLPGSSWLPLINLQELPSIFIFLRVWGKEKVRGAAVDQFQVPWYQTSLSSTFY